MQCRAIIVKLAAAGFLLLHAIETAACQEAISIDEVPGHRIDGDWYRFVNARYGFAEDIPAAGFIYELSEDGEELSITSEDGEKSIAVYGSQVVDPRLSGDEPKLAFAALAEAQIEAMRLGGINITQERIEAEWFEVAATDTEYLYYQKGMMRTNCPTLTSNLWIKYPVQATQEFDQAVKRMSMALAMTCPGAD